LYIFGLSQNLSTIFANLFASLSFKLNILFIKSTLFFIVGEFGTFHTLNQFLLAIFTALSKDTSHLAIAILKVSSV
jgi:hypothetical protein